ncbi:MAG: hypothetical protein P4L84_25940 [Isosphaeraceae bacterium]|nr:hypothetical protein [Isosphaeraceae bacterium]
MAGTPILTERPGWIGLSLENLRENRRQESPVLAIDSGPINGFSAVSRL